MRRDLRGLADGAFDLVVIGGGVFGAAAAWDATQRGLSVALIERADFASYTSANSYKVVHGGIRYLQHGDIYRIRQSAGERSAFLRIAPHLVQPLPIAIPTYGHGMKGKAALRAGVGVYDLLTADRNRGIPDPKRMIPNGHGLSRAETLDHFPNLQPGGLTGSVVFNDGQMQNPPRLVLAFVQSAVEAGAVAANYVEATGLIKEGDAVTGVEARDVLTGADFPIKAKMVLNAAGPYAESFLHQTLRQNQPGAARARTYSRDACFVVNRRLFDHDVALAAQGQTHDPDALVSRGNRHLFIAPWRDYTLIGTWHVVWKNDPAEIRVGDDELQSFLDEVQAGYPGLDLTLDDVSLWNCGLVPFGENDENATHLRYGHRSSLIDHAKVDRIDNLLTLIGVRFTTGRYEAEKAVDIVAERLGHRVRARTAVTPLIGGDFTNFEEMLDQAERDHGERLARPVLRSLLHHYGSRFAEVLKASDATPDFAAPVGESAIIKAQAAHAIRQEMAQDLGDIVFRRTDLATGAYPGQGALQDVVAVAAPMLGWDETRIKSEIDSVRSRFPKQAVAAADRHADGDSAAA